MQTTISIDSLVESMFKYIKQDKYKFVNIKEVRVQLEKILGSEYTSEIGIDVKNALKTHEKLEYFREGDCYHENKYFYSVGNFLAIKGLYDSPLEAKFKKGWYAFQDSDEVDFT